MRFKALDMRSAVATVLALALQTMQAPAGARAAAAAAASAVAGGTGAAGGPRVRQARAFCAPEVPAAGGCARARAPAATLRARGGGAGPGPAWTRMTFWGALRSGAHAIRRLGGVTRSPSRVLLRAPAAPPPAGARGASASAAPAAAGDDLWLEDVDSDAALDWVRAQNAQTFKTLGDPADSKLYPRLKAIYEAKDKIPYAVKRGDKYYNFWQDAENPRGLWRRTSWEEYQKASPSWEMLLDVDKLGKDEGKSWVWQGSIPVDLGPGIPATRCMVQLSPGGSDAVEMREFDLVQKRFIPPEEGGFYLPEAKSSADYLDLDTLLVGTSTDDAASVTSSGYPRQIRAWKRGTPLNEAPVVFEGEEADVSVSGFASRSGVHKYEWRMRSTSFYTAVYWVRKILEDGQTSEWCQINIPDDASVSLMHDQALLTLRTDWETTAGRTLVAGGLYALPLEDLLVRADANFKPMPASKAPADVTDLFLPSDTVSLQGWTTTKQFLIVTTLDNVKTGIEVWKLNQDLKDGGAGTWLAVPDRVAAGPFSLGVRALDDDEGDDVWVDFSSYSQPPTLSIGTRSEKVCALLYLLNNVTVR